MYYIKMYDLKGHPGNNWKAKMHLKFIKAYKTLFLKHNLEFFLDSLLINAFVWRYTHMHTTS